MNGRFRFVVVLAGLLIALLTERVGHLRSRSEIIPTSCGVSVCAVLTGFEPGAVHVAAGVLVAAIAGHHGFERRRREAPSEERAAAHKRERSGVAGFHSSHPALFRFDRTDCVSEGSRSDPASNLFALR